MDIRCPICGEPWDMDTLHDVVAEKYPNKPWKVNGQYDQTRYETYYNPVREDFRKRGCEALGSSHNECTNKNAAQLSGMLFDILGDDIDGIASELDDAEYLGII